MDVPFVDLPRQLLPFHNEVSAVLQDVVFKRADFIMRDDLLEFEKRFSEYLGVRHTIGVANGSDALNLSLNVLGLGPGDEVITVAHTFVATIAAIKHCGASPVLVDLGRDHTMDTTQLQRAITKRTKAILPVHLNGRACNMDEVMSIATAHNLHVVEDSAQAIGAQFRGRKAGTFGVLSTNSFYPFKILGCFGDGGAITTDGDELDYRLRCLRDNGQDREEGEIKFWGWNSRLDNLQAAVLMVMLKHVDELIRRRREVAEMYCDGLEGVGDLVVPDRPSVEGDRYDSFQNFVVETKDRDALVIHLRERGVGTLISWRKPTHWHRGLKLDHFRLPATERLSGEVVSLPLHPALTDAEAQYVVECVRQFYLTARRE